MSTPQLSDDRIIHLKDTHVGEPSDKHPLTRADWINFARAVEQAATAAQAEALATAQADAAAALGLLSKVRFALGDNGTRMQDELIEWCKGLNPEAGAAAVQAERERCYDIVMRAPFKFAPTTYDDIAEFGTPEAASTIAVKSFAFDITSEIRGATLTPTAPGAQEQA